MVVKTIVLTVLGFIFLGLGAVGIALPVLPTTPFVLLAAICFSAGNNRLAGWLRKNRIFGPYIENYRTKQGIELKLKVFSIIFVWFGLSISVFLTQNLWLAIGLFVVGIGVTIHLLHIKTKPKSTHEIKSETATSEQTKEAHPNKKA